MQRSHRSCFLVMQLIWSCSSTQRSVHGFNKFSNKNLLQMDEGVKLMSYDKNRLNSYFLEKTKSNKKMFILKHFLFDF